MQHADKRPRQGSRVTEVDLNAFDLIMEYGYKAKSNLDVANLIGCGEGTISRIRNGEQKPGNSVISGIGGLIASSSTAHHEFFQIFVFKDAQRREPVAA